MPKTASRYMQDLEFFDARLFVSAGDLVNFTSAGTSALTRTAAGNYNFAISASTTTFFAANLTTVLLRRTGMFEDLQEQFGGGGIPASAQPQVYRPDQSFGMSKAQQITPRTAFKVKGFRLLSFDAIYTVTTAAFATLQSRVDLTQFSNNVAPVITNIVPLAANNLVNVAQANPYVVNYPLTLAQEQAISNPAGGYPGYVTSPDQALWVEVDIVTGAGGTGTFYGIDCLVSFNFN